MKRPPPPDVHRPPWERYEGRLLEAMGLFAAFFDAIPREESVLMDLRNFETMVDLAVDPLCRAFDARPGRTAWCASPGGPGNAPTAAVSLYGRLFSVENPDADEKEGFTEFINPGSLLVLRDARGADAGGCSRGVAPSVRAPGRLGPFTSTQVEAARSSARRVACL